MAIKRNALHQYFYDIWEGAVSTLLGMKLTLGYFFGKPVTLLYPEKRPVVPENSRGLHVYEESKCIACSMCVNVCPVDCIALAYEGRGKEAFITKYDIDYQRCLFCNLCADVCPTKCVLSSPKWDFSGYTREGCVARLASPKRPEEIEKFKAEFAAKEAERKKQAAAKAAKPAE